MIPLALTMLLVLVPHPDDEVTVIPEIVAAGANAIVVVLTDGAATWHCPRLGMPRGSSECEQARRDSFEGFMSEVAPDATLVWLGRPDGGLNTETVVFLAVNLCDGCRILAAGADYGHPDHDATREAASALGGRSYTGEGYDDTVVYASVDKWYGWLGVTGDWRLGVRLSSRHPRESLRLTSSGESVY